MNDFFIKITDWVDAPRMVGFFFAVGTLGYLFVITTKHHKEFWEGIKGDDGKLQFIEGALTVWLTLFTAMIVADFAFGKIASDKAWWSMDTVFLVGVGGRVATVINRGNNKKSPQPKKGEDSGSNDDVGG